LQLLHLTQKSSRKFCSCGRTLNEVVLFFSGPQQMPEYYFTIWSRPLFFYILSNLSLTLPFRSTGVWVTEKRRYINYKYKIKSCFC
jgi:hypothetical protein